MMRFTWDAAKNKANRKKHGVWFEEAEQVFDDQNAKLYFDADNSIEEDRFIMLGMSASLRVLVVVYCERDQNTLFRIISARKATKKEIENYEKRI